MKLPKARVAHPIAYVLFLYRDNQHKGLQATRSGPTYIKIALKPSSSSIGPQVGVVALICAKAITA